MATAVEEKRGRGRPSRFEGKRPEAGGKTLCLGLTSDAIEIIDEVAGAFECSKSDSAEELVRAGRKGALAKAQREARKK